MTYLVYNDPDYLLMYWLKGKNEGRANLGGSE